MLADAKKQHDFKTIIVDDADRFTRASWRKAVIDIDALAEAGVDSILSARDGVFRIGDEHDAGEAHRLIAIAMSNHEYSRKLSRRISLARVNAAAEGKRAGGGAAYGFVNDGTTDANGNWKPNGLIKLGDPKEVKIVRWVFDQFTNHHRSMSWIAGELNRRQVPAPRSAKWTCRTLAQMLRRPAYCGDFVYNAKPRGRFFRVDGEGKVIEAAAQAQPGKVFTQQDVHKAIIGRELFEKTRTRLENLRYNRGLRKRVGYVLSGILICDHCGKPMYGCVSSGVRTYKCSSNSTHGVGVCGYHQIREDVILPLVMRLLGEEIKDLEEFYVHPPDELTKPGAERKENRKAQEKERATLAKQITIAEENLMFSEDARTRKSMDARITELRNKLDQLDAQLATPQTTTGYSHDDVRRLADWWEGFYAKAVAMPVPGGLPDLYAKTQYDREGGTDALMVDRRMANAHLHALGAEVRLRWRTVTVKGRAGKARKRHTLQRGRVRLGQRLGSVGFANSSVPNFSYS